MRTVTVEAKIIWTGNSLIFMIIAHEPGLVTPIQCMKRVYSDYWTLHALAVDNSGIFLLLMV